ncbi:MAG: fimbrillin family protein [Marinifilaceae bacterium]
MKHNSILLRFGYLLFAIMLASCAKDNAVLRIYENTGDSLNRYRIQITADVIDHLVPERTKSTPNINTLSPDAIVHIFVYKKETDPNNGSRYHKAIYKVSSKGKLNPIYDHLTLSEGFYNLYAVTVNNSTYDEVPEFDAQSGLFHYMYNNKDYLWSKHEAFEVNSNYEGTIHFRMTHSACKIQFSFQAADGNLEAIEKAYISATTEEECRWSISTGSISYATTKRNSLPLNIDQFTASGDMLPSEHFGGMTLTFMAKVDGTHIPLSLNIPPHYGNLFVPGHVYHYNVIIENNEAKIN